MSVWPVQECTYPLGTRRVPDAYKLWITRRWRASLKVIPINAQAVHSLFAWLFGVQAVVPRGLFALSTEVMPSINYYQGYIR